MFFSWFLSNCSHVSPKENGRNTTHLMNVFQTRSKHHIVVVVLVIAILFQKTRSTIFHLLRIYDSPLALVLSNLEPWIASLKGELEPRFCGESCPNCLVRFLVFL